MRIAHPITARSLSSLAHHHFLSSPNPLIPSSPPLKTPTKLLRSSLPRHPLMAATTEENVAVVSAEEDAKFGFTRPEMYSTNLAGTVDPYDRHVFLCFKSPADWLSHVEKSETDPLPKLLSSALKARKDEITVKTKMTICEGREGSDFEDGDVLIFPEMVKYKGLKESDVDSFVDDVLVNGKPWSAGVQEVMTGSHIFVCAHGSRDKRCGVCGPVLIDKLKEGIDSRGLQDQVLVSACSHVGGHKYAGNLIIYSPDSEGKIAGHWYGYVTPDDVSEILDEHIGKGVVIQRIWRGQLGVYAERAEKGAEKKLPNGKDEKKHKKHEESKAEVVNNSGCCQGANGVSCCRDASFEGNVEKVKENIEVQGEKGLGKLSSWINSLDQSDVLTGVAVVGAVATVVVAYSLYKRSN